MTEPRRQPTLKCRLAAALCALTDGSGQRLIPHEHAKLMSEDDVISLFHFDHYPIRHEAGGPLAHWNLDPRMIPDHRMKTATIDVPQVAKAKRLDLAETVHKAALASKAGDYTRAAEILAGAPKQPRRKQKIQSKGFRRAQPQRSASRPVDRGY